MSHQVGARTCGRVEVKRVHAHGVRQHIEEEAGIDVVAVEAHLCESECMM